MKRNRWNLPELLTLQTVVCLLVTMITTGCNRLPTPDALATVAAATATQIPLPTPTAYPAASGVPASLTHPPNPTATKMVFIQTQCIEQLSAIPPDAGLAGEVILEPIIPAAAGKPNSPLVISLSTGEERLFSNNPNEKVFGFRSSPDHTKLAYRQWMLAADGETVTTDSIVIADLATQALAVIPFDSESWGSYQWLGKDALLIRSLDDSYIMRVIQWQTGIEKIFVDLQHLPSRELFSPPAWGVVVNSQMDRIVYLQSDDENSAYSLVVWDAANKTTLATVPSEAIMVLSNGMSPLWSPDESRLIYSMSYEQDLRKNTRQELFSINRQGEIQRLTYLSDYFQGSVRLYTPSWSVTGSKIAFWVTAYQHGDQVELAVLDLQTDVVTLYCIRSGLRNISAPIWSPNGEQLILNGYDSEEELVSVVFIDLDKTYSAIVSENMTVSAWWLKTQK